MRSFFSCAREMPGTLLAVLFGSYFGSLWVGALHFPHGYDWRRDAISRLLSPQYNPGWYWLPSAGVVVSALCMLPLAAWIESELGDGENKLARLVRRPAFLVGILCLILSAVVPENPDPFTGNGHALRTTDAHGILAGTSAVELCVGMLCACGSAGLGNGAEGERGKRLRALRILWWATMAPPPIVAAVAGLAGLPTLGAGVAGYLRGTVLWYAAFWEWTGSVVVCLFFAGPVLILRRENGKEGLEEIQPGNGLHSGPD